MKIYIEYILLINFLIDYNVLFLVKKVLHRNVKLKKIIIGSIAGELSLIILLLKINYIEQIILKFILAIIINYIVFGFINIQYIMNNVIYFYMISTIYGGVISIIYNSINNMKLYIILFFLTLPCIFIAIRYIFSKNNKNYQYYFIIKIIFDKYELILNSFLDTGNKLIDPYTNKGIIIVDNKKIIPDDKIIYVPYKTINNTGIIKCIKPKAIEINGKRFNNYLIGISNESFNIDGIECILNSKLLEEINV